MRDKYPAQTAKGNTIIWSIGKKGYEHFLKNNYKVNGEFRDIFQNLPSNLFSFVHRRR